MTGQQGVLHGVSSMCTVQPRAFVRLTWGAPCGEKNEFSLTGTFYLKSGVVLWRGGLICDTQVHIH